MKLAQGLTLASLIAMTFFAIPQLASAQEVPSCGEGQTLRSFSFDRAYQTHARALSGLAGLVKRTAKAACSEAELPVVASIVASEHAIAAGREQCPMRPCVERENGTLECPPCDSANYVATGSASACCAPRRTRARE